MRILLIEHDSDLVEEVRANICSHFELDVSYTGYDGSYLSQVNDYAAIVIDSSLPDSSGFEVCKDARGAGITSPVIILSDRNDLDSKLTTFASGAYVLIEKPLNCKELVSTVGVLVTKKAYGFNKTHASKLELGDLVLDQEARCAIRKGKKIALRKKEFYILEFLLLKKNKVVTRDQLLDHIWEDGACVASNTLDVHIKSLRDKIDKKHKKKLIKTIHGLGYSIQA